MQSKKGEILLLTNGAGTVGLPFKEKKNTPWSYHKT